jgi:N-acetylglucosaminyldiphosphoundecaprenol N-acetyl-beta-D-mannosaminyltransferase
MSISDQTVNILGVKVSRLDKGQLLSAVDLFIRENQKAIIASGNVHSINLAQHLQWYKDFLNSADIVHVDGAGLNFGARILGETLPERITWADFGWDLAEMAAQKGHSMFFLGAKPGVAATAAEKLQEKNPDLRIGGIHHGYFDKTPDSEENQVVLDLIQSAAPDMLWIGFGMPLQAQWIQDNFDQISAHVIFTVGAAFDYLSGTLKRAPTWMTDHSMEWFGRMLIEPKRLWRRYVIGNPLFLLRMIRQRLKKID